MGLTLKRWLPVAVLVVAVVAFFALDLGRFLTFDALRENRALLMDLVDENRLVAVLAYVVVYAVVIALSLPGGALMTVTGGFLFGVALASVSVVVGATVGATLIFLIARSAIGEALHARAGPWLSALEKGFRENALSYLLFLRLVPVFPFFVVNLVPALLGMRLGPYILGTAIGITPAVVVFSTVGAGFGSILDSGESFSVDSALTPEVLLALSGLAVLALIPIVVKKFKARKAG